MAKKIGPRKGTNTNPLQKIFSQRFPFRRQSLIRQHSDSTKEETRIPLKVQSGSAVVISFIACHLVSLFQSSSARSRKASVVRIKDGDEWQALSSLRDKSGQMLFIPCPILHPVNRLHFWVLFLQICVFAPEPFGVEFIKISSCVLGQVMQPIGQGTGKPAPLLLSPYLQRIAAGRATRLTKHADIQHGPIQKLSVGAFLRLGQLTGLMRVSGHR